MAKIKYIGLSHFRELAAADFKKLGVEGQKFISFARHEATEVSDDVADALLGLLGDEFQKVKEDVAKASKSSTSSTEPPEDTQSTNPPGHFPEDQPSASAS